MTTTTKTNDGRTLQTGNCCGCGKRLEIWVLEGDVMRCRDCSADIDRELKALSVAASLCRAMKLATDKQRETNVA